MTPSFSVSDQALAGRTVVVCRSAMQAGPLTAALYGLGSHVVRLPLVEIVVPEDGGSALARATERLAEYDWVVLTSANGVRALIGSQALPDWPPNTRIAVIGSATAAAVRAAGLIVDFQPREATARDLAEALPIRTGSAEAEDGGVRVLAPLAELAGPEITSILAARGARVDVVTAYRSVTPEHSVEVMASAREADAVLIGSGSTIDRLVDALGVDSLPACLIAIGPATAESVRRHGLEVAAIADPHDDAGLIAAAVRTLRR